MVDRRTGSGELLQPIIRYGVPAQAVELEYGDFAFEGNGPDGKVMIGIERKRLRDMMASIRSGRFSGHQLPGLIASYDFCYLLLEGLFRPEQSTGMLQELNHGWKDVTLGEQRFLYRELYLFLCSMERKTPLRVHRSSYPSETVLQIVDLYRWWSKEWEQHKSHQGMKINLMESVVKPPLTVRVARELKGIGDSKARAVGKKFRSVQEMANAGPDDWIGIDGVGKKLAEQAVKELTGEA